MSFLGGENAPRRIVPPGACRQGLAARWCAQSAAALMLVAGCGSPCDALAERVCSDLDEADCQLWIADSRLSQGMLPLDDPGARRLSVAGPTCERWLAEGTYETETLPTVRARIARARTGGAREPLSLPGGSGSEAVLEPPPVAQYLLFPAALALIAFAAWFGHRKLKNVAGAPRPRLSTPPP